MSYSNSRPPFVPHRLVLIGLTLLPFLWFSTTQGQKQPAPAQATDIPQWQLLAFDDFNEPKENANNQFSMIGENRVLGDHSSKTQQLSIPVAESSYLDLKIAFDFYFIDSWDDEFASLEAQVQYSDGTSGAKKLVWKEAGHAHFFPSNIAGNIYRDYRANVIAILDGMDPSKRVNGIDLYFTADIGSLGLDESWAVDNVEVYGR